jgi:aldehyde dehydrogenase (NAD+)
MGKLKTKHGRIPGDDDIADLAVGQSRMLYGLTMHSEEPITACRTMESMGIVGVITPLIFR